jgi:2-(1,2-epoxy-1,2-dihydrophenyl)acetyl-CoA isomerase
MLVSLPALVKEYPMNETSPNEPAVQWSVDNGVAVARLNRPKVRNAIDDTMRRTLISALDDAAADPEIRALVLTGNGSSFCAGGDVAAMRERLNAPAGQVAGNAWRRQRETHTMALTLHNLIKVTVAAVNGPAIGVGADLALGCDFLIASNNTVFAFSHLTRGLVPDGGSMYHLPRRVGMARAKELMFTGRRFGAAEALEMGLVDRVVPADELLPAATGWAAELSVNSPTATSLTKSILNRSFELSPHELFALGAEAAAICYTSEEHRSSVEKFLSRT